MCPCNHKPCTCYECPKPTTLHPHKHAALIKAWADGAEIEVYNNTRNIWQCVEEPCWDRLTEYRIKPIPKPDRTEIRYLTYHPVYGVRISLDKGVGVALVFDGETATLKSVYLL